MTQQFDEGATGSLAMRLLENLPPGWSIRRSERKPNEYAIFKDMFKTLGFAVSDSEEFEAPDFSLLDAHGFDIIELAIQERFSQEMTEWLDRESEQWEKELFYGTGKAQPIGIIVAGKNTALVTDPTPNRVADRGSGIGNGAFNTAYSFGLVDGATRVRDRGTRFTSSR